MNSQDCDKADDGLDYRSAACLQTIKESLASFQWDVYCENRRLVYVNHVTQENQWIPPSDMWQCAFGLPYGWETAVDTSGKSYFISHVQQTTTYDDPRLENDLEPPEPRDVILLRDAEVGFGFVAGSERPVVVRFVTEGGPSIDKLLPGDEILAVNGEDVREVPKDHVVNLVRNCPDQVQLTVCQPRSCNSNLKSALLSASKRARLKNNPTRVRFAEGVIIGTPPDSPSRAESCVALMPNVLRVFLENGQTKSFKYDQATTVEDVMESLRQKLCLGTTEYFVLALEHPQGPRSQKLSFLRHEEKVTRIAARPGAQHFRCLFRVAFVPTDPLEVLKADPVAFDYFHQQCINDVVQGRYAYEMRYEACLRLAALHMQQCALDNGHTTAAERVSLKKIEYEYGLGSFLPTILLDNVKLKEIRKHLRYYLKRDVSTESLLADDAAASGGSFALECSSLTQSQMIKLKYLHLLGNLPSFGGRTFYVTFKDTNTDMIMQIGPRTGITVRNTGRTMEPTLSLLYDLIAGLAISDESEVLKLLSISLRAADSSQTLDFHVDKDDIYDLVLFIQGYYYLATRIRLEVRWEKETSHAAIPPYFGLHSVKPSHWNYIAAPVTGEHSNAKETKAEADVNAAEEVLFHGDYNEQERRQSQAHGNEVLVDLSRGPPKYDDTVMKYVTSKRASQVEIEAAPVPVEPNPPCELAVQKSGVELESECKAEAEPSTKTIEEDEWQDSFGDADGKSTTPKLNRKPNKEDPFVRKTFLRARDSLMIRNRAGSRAKEVVALRSVSKERTGDISSVSGSDTESISTPSPSPIHRALAGRKRSPASRPRSLTVTGVHNRKDTSFGLKSPDTLPCSLLSDVELQQIVTSCGLEGQQVEDVLQLFPDNFCTDTEIIDLTMDNDVSDNVAKLMKTPMSSLGIGNTSRRRHSATVTSNQSGISSRHPSVSPCRAFADKTSGKALGLFDVISSRSGKREDDDAELQSSSKAATIPTSSLMGKPDANLATMQQQSTGDVRRTSRLCQLEGCLQQRNDANDEENERNASVCRANNTSRSNTTDAPTSHCRLESSRNETKREKNAAPGDAGGPRTLLSGRTNCSGDHQSSSSSVANSQWQGGDRKPDIEAATVRQCKDRVAPTAETESFDSDWTMGSSSMTLSTGVDGNEDDPICVTTVISLKTFTGLETSDHEAPIVTRVSLRDFHGLESSPIMERRNSACPTDRSSPMPTARTDQHRSLALTADWEQKRDKGRSEDDVDQFTGQRQPSRSGDAARSGDSSQASPVVNGTVRANGSTSAASSHSSETKSDSTSSRDFEQAQAAILRLLEQLKHQMDVLPLRSPRNACPYGDQETEQQKRALLNEAQQLASISKMLVRNVVETHRASASDWETPISQRSAPFLDQGVDGCFRLYSAAVRVTNALGSLFHGQTLGARMREVMVAFERTLDAAKCARGRSLGSDEMKRLMRQSTTLAATLTQLIRTTREI